MSRHPKPSSPDWNAWATLANDVTAALQGHLEEHIPLDVRSAIAEDLWDAGYRPNPQQVTNESRRQHGLPPLPERPAPLPNPTTPSI